MAASWARRGATLIVLAALLTIVGPMPARAQNGDELATLRRQVSRLHSQGKYAEAIPVAERYVSLARQRHGEEHTEFATAISWLAIVYQAQGRYGEAEPLYQRALALYEKALGRDHPDVGTSLNNLAGLYRAPGRYGVAEPRFQRALALRDR